MRVLRLATVGLAAVTLAAAQTQEEPHALRGAVMEEDKARRSLAEPEGLVGYDLLNGIRNIIDKDPLVPPDKVQSKPFMGSFTTIKSTSDPEFANVAYCMTDNPCGNPLSYVTGFMPDFALRCNSICYIDKNDKTFHRSKIYSASNLPPSYLCCSVVECG